MKNATLSRPQKRLLFIGWMLNQKTAQLGTCICVGHLKFFTVQHMSINDYKSIVSVELGITNKFWWVGQFTNNGNPKL